MAEIHGPTGPPVPPRTPERDAAPESAVPPRERTAREVAQQDVLEPAMNPELVARTKGLAQRPVAAAHVRDAADASDEWRAEAPVHSVEASSTLLGDHHGRAANAAAPDNDHRTDRWEVPPAAVEEPARALRPQERRARWAWVLAAVLFLLMCAAGVASWVRP